MTLKKTEIGAPELELAARVAETARISVDDEEVRDLAEYINEFLGYADALAGAPEEAGLPDPSAVEGYEAREDVAERSDVGDSVLQAAPRRRGSFFVVPRILGARDEEASI